jgi:hypothetical protein
LAYSVLNRQLVELIAHERIASFRREAVCRRLVRDASVETAERAAPGLLRDVVGDCTRADDGQRDAAQPGVVGVD